MFATKLVKPLVATALAVVAFGATATVAQAADYSKRPHEPMPAVAAADYAPDRLTRAMLHSDYPLQALLYTVVLHRFLRWRVPAYDPGAQLGGVLYLFVRGMCGPRTPAVGGVPAGVFSAQGSPSKSSPTRA